MRIGFRSHCLHVDIFCAKYVMAGFCCYELFTFYSALLHIQHSKKDGAEYPTEIYDVKHRKKFR